MLKKVKVESGDSLFTEVLPNGLEVFYLPRTEYNQVYGLLSTKFGSLQTNFSNANSEMEHYPSGIAHFLEHKLFEKEGGDVMYKFSQLGAQTNAFTSFNRTAYLFYTRENIGACVTLLLDFVQTPYFTEDSIKKEQGIIGQEIQMYQDDPDWLLFAGILASLYPESPLAEDIAGTRQSIAQITPEMLSKNYHAFYRPENMSLFIAGNFDLDAVREIVRENQKDKKLYSEKPDVLPFSAKEAIPKVEKTLEVAGPKLALGYRGEDERKTSEFYRYRLIMSLFFEASLGRTSAFYESNYKKGLLDDSFSVEFEGSEDFHCLLLTADTQEPEKLSTALQETLKSYKISDNIEAQQLELFKNKMLGSYYASLNSLDFIANEFANQLGSKTLFDFPQILSEISLVDIEKTAAKFFDKAQMAEYIIRPK